MDDLQELLTAHVAALTRQFATQYTAVMEELRAENAELRAENAELRERNAQLTASSSETQQMETAVLGVVVQQMETAVLGVPHRSSGPSESANMEDWTIPADPASTNLLPLYQPTPATPALSKKSPPKPPYSHPPEAPPPDPPESDLTPPDPPESAGDMWYEPPENPPPPAMPPFPRVHVLLSPAGGDRTAPAPDLVRGQVCVLGLPQSGTNALCRYVQEFFDVDVQPHKGASNFEHDYWMWNHELPKKPLVFPSYTSKGPVTVLLVARDIESWMHSLGRGSDEIVSTPGYLPDSGLDVDLDWMFQQVTLKFPFKDEPPNEHFPDVMHVWAQYTNGYLRGHIAPESDPNEHDDESNVSRVVVVRFEDILEVPEDVVGALACLGLPRNSKDFSPIEESVSDAAETRGNILLRERHLHLTDELRNKIALGLADHSHLVEWLGYSKLNYSKSLEHLQQKHKQPEPGDEYFGIVWDKDSARFYCILCSSVGILATRAHLHSSRHKKVRSVTRRFLRNEEESDSNATMRVGSAIAG